VSPEESRIRWI